jgi:prefoldin subunit 5
MNDDIAKLRQEIERFEEECQNKVKRLSDIMGDYKARLEKLEKKVNAQKKGN